MVHLRGSRDNPTIQSWYDFCLRIVIFYCFTIMHILKGIIVTFLLDFLLSPHLVLPQTAYHESDQFLLVEVEQFLRNTNHLIQNDRTSERKSLKNGFNTNVNIITLINIELTAKLLG